MLEAVPCIFGICIVYIISRVCVCLMYRLIFVHSFLFCFSLSSNACCWIYFDFQNVVLGVCVYNVICKIGKFSLYFALSMLRISVTAYIMAFIVMLFKWCHFFSLAYSSPHFFAPFCKICRYGFLESRVSFPSHCYIFIQDDSVENSFWISNFVNLIQLELPWHIWEYIERMCGKIIVTNGKWHENVTDAS